MSYRPTPEERSRDLLESILDVLVEIRDELQAQRQPPPSLTWTQEAWQKVRDEKRELREGKQTG